MLGEGALGRSGFVQDGAGGLNRGVLGVSIGASEVRSGQVDIKEVGLEKVGYNRCGR